MWLFQPLMPGAAQQLSDPFAVTHDAAASATDVHDATVVPPNVASEAASATDTHDGITPIVVDHVSYPTVGAGAAYYGQSTAIGKLAFSNEAASTLSATLSVAHSNGNGLASESRGYFLYDDGGSNVIDYLSLATETTGTCAQTVVFPRYGAAAVSSSTDGYVAEGLVISGGTATNHIFGFNYATEAYIGYAIYGVNAFTILMDGCSSSSAGYIGGGAPTYQSVIDKLLFSTQVASTLSATLSVGRRSTSGLESDTKGYFGGGTTGAASAVIDGLTFSSEAASAITATLSVARNSTSAAPSSTNGYWMGGTGGAYEVDGILLSDESATNSSTALSTYATKSPTASRTYINLPAQDTSTGELAGVTITETASAAAVFDQGVAHTAAITESNPQDLTQDGGTGYFGGGTGAGGSGVHSLAFANDATAFNVATLDTSGTESSGASSQLKGYFWGGQSRQAVSTLVFSNLTSATLAATTGDFAYGQATFSAPDCGYFCGGYTSNLDGIRALMFSSETIRTPSATLPTGRGLGTGVKSATTGYVLGGYTSGSGYFAEIDGVVFATESVVNPSAALSVARHSGGSAQSTTIGYCLGGSASGGTSAVVDGIRFSDEAAVTGANALTESASRGGSASSYRAGYFANPNVVNNQYCHKITFSSEATSVASYSFGDRVSTCGVQKNIYLARSAVDESSVTGSSPVSLAESVSSAGTPAATYVTASTMIESVANTSAQTGVVTFSVSAPESVTAAAAHPVTMVAPVAHQASGTATDTPVGLPLYPASVTESLSASDTHDGVIVGLYMDITEAATAAATHSVVALFVSAIAESASAVGAHAGGFLVGDTEAATSSDVSGGTLTFTSVETAAASADAAPSVSAVFASSSTQAASAVDTSTGSASVSVGVSATGAASDSTDSTITIVALEQTTATFAADATPQWVGFIAEASAATATFNGTGPVPAAIVESLAAGASCTVKRYVFSATAEDASAVGAQAAVVGLVVSIAEALNAGAVHAATGSFSSAVSEALIALSSASAGRAYISSIYAVGNAGDYSDAHILALLQVPAPAVTRIVRIGTSAVVMSIDSVRIHAQVAVVRKVVQEVSAHTVVQADTARVAVTGVVDRNVGGDEAERVICQ